MRLRYTRRASGHIANIHEYITKDDPDAARRVIERVRAAAQVTVDYPYIGREGALAGTREFKVPGIPYLLVYRMEIGDEDTIVVLGVYHAAQSRDQDTF